MRLYPLCDDTFINGGEVDISANYYPHAYAPTDAKPHREHSRVSMRKNGLDYEVYIHYSTAKGPMGNPIEEVVVSTRDPLEFVAKASNVEWQAMKQIGASDGEIIRYIWVPLGVIEDIKKKTGRKYAPSANVDAYARMQERIYASKPGDNLTGLGLPDYCPECGNKMQFFKDQYGCLGMEHTFAVLDRDGKWRRL